jgi:hypothetical protein
MHLEAVEEGRKLIGRICNIGRGERGRISGIRRP